MSLKPLPENRGLDAYDYWRIVGTERATAVAEAAGTTFAYFRHVYKCRRRPSVDMAKRLVEESAKESAAHPKRERATMGLDALLKTHEQMAVRREELRTRGVE